MILLEKWVLITIFECQIVIYMKIVILGTAHPYRGGIAALNERLAQELVSQGHEVEIYNFSRQ